MLENKPKKNLLPKKFGRTPDFFFFVSGPLKFRNVNDDHQHNSL